MNFKNSCDRCNSTTVHAHFDRQLETFSIEIEEDDLIESHDFSLCKGCQSRLLNWVENGPDRSNMVDLEAGRHTAKTLSEIGSELQSISEDLESLSTNDE